MTDNQQKPATAAEVLQRYMDAYPAFRIKPKGEPGSPVRIEQENLMALEDAARAALAAKPPLDKTGGSAFPGKDILQVRHGTLPMYHAGMSLRDWFAGKAMSQLAEIYTGDVVVERYAAEAYRIADAMLAEREKTS